MKLSRAAFTLIELLVVIVVIAVLAAISLPVYGIVQENARGVKCTSNLKQIGAGILGYAADHNGMCPLSGGSIPYSQGADPSTPGLGWTQQIEPYIGGQDKRIFVCPSSSKLFPNNAKYSYFQGCHAAYMANGSSAAALRLSFISTPTKYILAGDISSNSAFTDNALNDADKDDFTQNPAFATTPCPFHRGKANLVFADGHAGAFAAFDKNAMTTCYGLKPDGTGYAYTDAYP